MDNPRTIGTSKEGFTLVEVVASMVIAGIVVAIAGMGIVSSMKGYLFARNSIHIAQKAQLAMTRLKQEFTGITELSAASGHVAGSTLVYRTLTGWHAVARVGNAVKLVDAATPPSSGSGEVLVNQVGEFTLTYSKRGSGGTLTAWVPGTDIVEDLAAINITLKLTRDDIARDSVAEFYTSVAPRNIRQTDSSGGFTPWL